MPPTSKISRRRNVPSRAKVLQKTSKGRWYWRRKTKKKKAVRGARTAFQEAFPMYSDNLAGPSTSSSKPKQGYTCKRKASAQAWQEKRSKILESVICANCMPSVPCSFEGCTVVATSRCFDCGPLHYFCEQHLVKSHQRKLHVPEIWKDGTFVPTFIKQLPWRSHECSTTKERQIQVVDVKGRHHGIPVNFCDCFDDVVTLVNLRLWPGSPTCPRIAFQWELMDLLHIMFVEGHVSLQNMGQVLTWLSPPYLQTRIKDPYKSLSLDAFAEFRYFVTALDNITLSENSPVSPSCPACPKEDGRLIVSLDGIFGLHRWKKSGTGILPPRHAGTYFVDQTKVDQFVSGYKHVGNTAKQNCNSFQAGNVLTEKSKEKVDETGIFGAVCRHEMPLKFFNMKQGEKIANSVYLIKHILNEKPDKAEVLILYDIACMLESHLKRSKQEEMLSNIKLAVPAFHIYGHKLSCQMKYSPRRADGFALSDGEQVERLWSFLKKFASMTKEMTSPNRIDALTDALIHYAKKTVANMGHVLYTRYERAKKTKEEVKDQLEDVLQQSSEATSPITMTKIKLWASQLPQPQLPHPSVTGMDMSNDELYVVKLSSYFDLCKKLDANQTGPLEPLHLQLLAKQAQRCDQELQVLEGDRPRLSETSPSFLNVLQQHEDKVRRADLDKLHGMSVERWHLVLLKKNYSDGQKISLLLRKQISNKNNEIKKKIQSYNTKDYRSTSLSFPSELVFEHVIDLKDSLWDVLDCTDDQREEVPVHVRRKVADMFLLQEHSEDELQLLLTEMANVQQSFMVEIAAVQDKIDTATNLTQGQLSLFKAKIYSLNHLMSTVCSPFASLIDLADVPQPSPVAILDWNSTPIITINEVVHDHADGEHSDGDMSDIIEAIVRDEEISASFTP